MFQLQHEYVDKAGLEQFVLSVKMHLAEKPGSKALFHIYNDTAKRDVTDSAAAVIRDILPDAPYVGCSTGGNIVHGALEQGTHAFNLSVIADVYEDPDTSIEVFQYALDEERRITTAAALRELVKDRPWVKAVELITTVIDVRMIEFCKDLSKVRDDIVFFGGGALCSETINIFTGLPYVFSCAGESTSHGVAFVLYGGDELHVKTQVVVGWKPLGPQLKVTRSEGPIIYEIDGVPAFERYHHYLNIDNNEAFSDNSLLFPFAFDHKGMTIIKAPVNVEEGGALALTSNVSDRQRTFRIAYGDPATILDSVRENVALMREFAPQAIHAFSCAARLMYWGPDEVSRETDPFDDLAPTAGFYTGGEFARYDGDLLHYNVTLVLVGIREGAPCDEPVAEVEVNDTAFSRHMAIVHSLTALVGVTSSELEAAYEQMRLLAVTDGLTEINNRLEIETRIEAALDEHENELRRTAGSPDEASVVAPSVVMLDIDDFKRINDTYGHKAGDDVLRSTGRLLKSVAEDRGVGASGRWGGEEFMILLPHGTIEEAERVAREVCSRFAETRFEASGSHTLSAGVTQAREGETSDSLCQRVDKALYTAKKQGKNRVVVA